MFPFLLLSLSNSTLICTLLNLCTTELCTVELSTFELCTIDLCTTELCIIELCTIPSPPLIQLSVVNRFIITILIWRGAALFGGGGVHLSRPPRGRGAGGWPVLIRREQPTSKNQQSLDADASLLLSFPPIFNALSLGRRRGWGVSRLPQHLIVPPPLLQLFWPKILFNIVN